MVRVGGEWQLVKWESALPSRIQVKLPTDIAKQIETARRSYQRFGEFSKHNSMFRLKITKIGRSAWRA